MRISRVEDGREGKSAEIAIGYLGKIVWKVRELNRYMGQNCSENRDREIAASKNPPKTAWAEQ